MKKILHFAFPENSLNFIIKKKYKKAENASLKISEHSLFDLKVASNQFSYFCLSQNFYLKNFEGFAQLFHKIVVMMINLQKSKN